MEYQSEIREMYSNLFEGNQTERRSSVICQ